MFKNLNKKIEKHIKKQVHKHIKKHQHKHVHKILHIIHHTHHALAHMGELLVIGLIGLGGFMFASSGFNYEEVRRTNTETINIHLAQAIVQETPQKDQSKIISIRSVESKVWNTFVPGYCTWGIALISPEFFPYTDEFTQARTRGGNAGDRCKNAQDTGFVVDTTPEKGSLIVYQKAGQNGYFGHVGKVIYLNTGKQNMIIREMNRLSKFTMDDRRENTNNDAIKCFIHPKKNENIQNNNTTILDDITIVEKPPVEKTSTSQTTIPTIVTQTGSNTSLETIPPITKVTTGDREQIHEAATIVPTIPANQEPENTGVNIPLSEGEGLGVRKDEISENISFSLSNLSDIAQYFFETHTLHINKKNNNGKIEIILNFVDKETGNAYEGILPFSLQSISNNDVIKATMGNIGLVHNGKITIPLLTQKKGEGIVILTIDDQTIASIPVQSN